MCKNSDVGVGEEELNTDGGGGLSSTAAGLAVPDRMKTTSPLTAVILVCLGLLAEEPCPRERRPNIFLGWFCNGRRFLLFPVYRRDG